MKKTCLVIMGLLMILTGIGYTGCSTESNDLTIQDEAAIYAVVIRQLATIDDTFGGNLNPKTLYVIKNTDDSAGYPFGDQQPDKRVITDTMQSEITRMINDLSIESVWIDKFEDAKFEESGFEVKRDGAIIKLGNIHLQADGSVQVAGSIYIANLAAGGTTYILVRIDEAWAITGQASPSWIS